MGVDYEAKIVYGLDYMSAVEGLSQEEIEEVNDMLDWGELEYASPYYDSPRDRWFVGFILEGNGFGKHRVDTLMEEMAVAHKAFCETFKKSGRIEARLHVY